jgi:hypothetical protein
VTTPLRTSALSAAAIADAVFTLEDRLDLSASVWQQDDVHWWPLYRTELYRLAFVSAAGRALAVKPALGPLARAPRWEQPHAPPGAVWFVSDGASYARQHGHDIERFCGPLSARCRALGWPALTVDRARRAPPHAAEPTRWIAPWTLRAKVGATLAARLRRDRRHVELVHRVHAAAQQSATGLTALSAPRMQALAGTVLRLAARIESCLRREHVRAMFLVSYYDVAGYACVLAAARAGIVSVDVQHGVAGRFNLAYARWPAALQPYRLLPRRFWTWTESDADVIADWADERAHRALCGGNPYLDAWRDGSLRTDSAQQREFDALVARSGARTKVLVTLQPHLMHADALKPLIEAMQTTDDVCWWLRLHPLCAGERSMLQGQLPSSSMATVEIDAPTDLPLPALLAKADAHATHSSSTVLEAAALRVPNIVWSGYGAELYAAALQDGQAQRADDGRALVAALASAGKPVSAAVRTSADALSRILEEAA